MLGVFWKKIVHFYSSSFFSSFRDSTYTDADNIPDDMQGDFNGGMFVALI